MRLMIADGPDVEYHRERYCERWVSKFEDSPLNRSSDINHRHRFYPRMLTGRVEDDNYRLVITIDSAMREA